MSFKEVVDTQRETALVIIVSLAIFVGWFELQVIPNIIEQRYYVEVLFYAGIIFFSIVLFFFAELVNIILGNGISGILYFVFFGAVMIIGSVIGGRVVHIFLSGSFLGVIIFYAKSIAMIAYFFRIEARPSDSVLTLQETFSPEQESSSRNYQIIGIGSDFETLRFVINSLKGDNQLLFYTYYVKPEYSQFAMLFQDTIRFYANHFIKLHTVETGRTSHIIQRISFDCSDSETLEKGLLNYWLRAHLSGIYQILITPYDGDLVVKSGIIRNKLKEGPIKAPINEDEFLIQITSLRDGEPSIMELSTYWSPETVVEKISESYPIMISDSL